MLVLIKVKKKPPQLFILAHHITSVLWKSGVSVCHSIGMQADQATTHTVLTQCCGVVTLTQCVLALSSWNKRKCPWEGEIVTKYHTLLHNILVALKFWCPPSDCADGNGTWFKQWTLRICNFDNDLKSSTCPDFFGSLQSNSRDFAKQVGCCDSKSEFSQMHL